MRRSKMTYNRDMSDWNIPDSKKIAAYLKAERAFKKTFEDQRFGRQMEVQKMTRNIMGI